MEGSPRDLTYAALTTLLVSTLYPLLHYITAALYLRLTPPERWPVKAPAA